LADDIRARMVELLPRLRRYALVLTRDLEKADDLVQETCVRALSRLDQWQPGTRLDSWLYRIAQNLWLDRKRAEKVRGVQVDVESVVGLQGVDGRAVTEARLTLETVARHMQILSPEQQLLVVLVSIDGLTYKEAADALEIPIGTVMSRLARARRTLYESLEGEMRNRGPREASGLRAAGTRPKSC